MLNYYKISKAMSDTNRIKILHMLSEGELNVTNVADNLDVEENLASHHLRVLSTLGFLKSDKKGREVFYRINKPGIARVFRGMFKSSFLKDLLTEPVEK
ncbi:MAG: hypothetical protein RLY61_31 [Candidatus Parcubacteria bacterium]|jgi:ArsR family transcriptional regulator